MKIRTDFVTNSSSSSFIVAVRNGTSQQEIEQYANNLLPSIVKYATNNGYKHDSGTLLDAIIAFLTGVLNDGMNLDTWKVTAITVSNEDSCIYAYLYSCGLKETEWLKSESIF